MLRTLSGTLAVLVAATALAGTAVATDNGLPQTVKQGPSGLRFYTPPSSVSKGDHGSVIWARKVTNDVALPAASHNYLVLYRSVTADGRKVAVSGTVAVPKGKPPRNGWPVISWAHGTTGVADVCAPSRNAVNSPEHTSLIGSQLYLNNWVKAGYAVARTDYQGLGTPGPHAYLIGLPEARAVIDMTLAARAVSPVLGRRWLALGHSQGGHSTLFAARYGQSWAPGLRLVGAIAAAPASHLSEQAAVLVKLTGPLPLAGIVPLVIVGVEAAGYTGTAQLLTELARSKLPLTDSLCEEELEEPAAWGSLLTQDTFNPTASPDSFLAILAANEPAKLKLKVPILMLQGTADKTVIEPFTTQLVASLRQNGAKVTYNTYPSQTHSSVLASSFKDALRWTKNRF